MRDDEDDDGDGGGGDDGGGDGGDGGGGDDDGDGDGENDVDNSDNEQKWMVIPNTQRVTPLSPHAAGDMIDMLEPGLRFSQSFQLWMQLSGGNAALR